MKVDFSLRVETEEEPYGPMVIVKRTLFNGEVEVERMEAVYAADEYRNPGNGTIYKSSHIEFNGVYDEYGMSHTPMISDGGNFRVI